MKLREAIAQVLTRPLTYREITALINEMHLYRTSDGMLVPVDLVRVTVRAYASIFGVDRAEVPHKVSLIG